MRWGIRLKNIIMILFGSAIFSFGIVHFNMENNLAEGGFTGITLLLYFLYTIDPALSNIVLNIPVFFIGWRYLGRTTFVYTVIGTIAVSIFLWIFQDHIHFSIPLHNDMTLAALFAGVFLGVGLGIIFRYGGTTGGVDIIARLISKYTGVSIGRAMFVFDFFVIAASILLYLDYTQGMYTLVAVFLGAKVIDFMQEAAYSAKGAFVISNDYEAIAQQIMNDMDRGVTVFKAEGSYSKQERNVLYCVVARNEIVRLKNVIHKVDPHAFVSITEVKDVLGEGFTFDENRNPMEP
ncbi:YitT family protein [Bacillaceae bacterium SIJ1]|uniref:YitT family protein n=1 Tax=Litoribacterium kuwaitense TaxID=1398745 RepID=UPI0013EC65EA|nr:YitT family protein [Litoribacterium kuwaitense]NGP43728.1 YitT family protein [Litoribacterium kuwaitense]